MTCITHWDIEKLRKAGFTIEFPRQVIARRRHVSITENKEVECDPKPVTFEQKSKAARKAVELYRSGHRAIHALRLAGILHNYTIGLTECHRGHGPCLDAARNGIKKVDGKTRQSISFCRWFLGINPDASRTEELECERLRKAIKKSGMTFTEIGKKTLIHCSTISKFASGEKGMRPETRAKLWEALK